MASLRFQEQSARVLEQHVIDEEGKTYTAITDKTSPCLAEQKKIIANYEKQDELMTKRAKVRINEVIVMFLIVLS